VRSDAQTPKVDSRRLFDRAEADARSLVIVRPRCVTALAAYDSLGELVATCSPDPVAAQTCTSSNITTSTAAWRYGYDLMGHQTSATPPTMAIATQLASVSATYDTGGGGRLDHTTQGVRTTTPSYDAAGRVYASAVVVGSNNFTTTNTLDSLGRTTQVAVTGTTTDTITETYDSLGRLTDLARSGSTLTHFVYNADGTASSRTDRVGSSSLTSNFSYTDLGQLASASLPSGYGGAASYTWGLDGVIASRTWGSYISATYAYDLAKRPVGLTLSRSGAGVTDTWTRTYDAASNVAGSPWV
jgi:hypothetical protein